MLKCIGGKKRFSFVCIYAVTTCLGLAQAADKADDITEIARQWLSEYNSTGETVFYDDNVANWNYNTNITDYNLNLANKADTRLALFQQEAAKNASHFDVSSISDPEIARQIRKLSKVGIKLNADDSFLLSQLVGNMTSVYSTATVCSMNTTHHIDCAKKWSLEPDLQNVLASSKDYDLQQYAWEAWRNASGRPIRQMYKQFMDLSNKGAREDGFRDTGDYWRSLYEDDSFREDIEKIWYEVLPLYEQLYTYVRKVLRDQVYDAKRIGNVLPAHVLGNMWAQEWNNVFAVTAPYPKEPSVDVTEAMKSQGYDPLRMFHTADQFFQSLGLIAMPESFYKDSMITKPSDRDVVCHASAWDFYNRRDVRIKMCTEVNMEDLITIHHEMGHIEYFLQYSHQPLTFRDGANPGFHEAIGDTMALSVATPEHLHSVGLLPDYQPNEKQTINFLYKTALEKIAFLPFGYLIDQWRWSVFDGNFDYNQWNDGWWQLRYKYQGLKPPSPRKTDDFDPGSKYHVPANSPYISYFVARLAQFQFYEAMCSAAGHKGPLHTCDFANNTKAGEALANMLRMGSSKPWPEAMKAITGQSALSAKALIDYFDPLITWLKDQNKGECFGWGYQWPEYVMSTLESNRCAAPAPEDVDSFLKTYNAQAADVYNNFVRAEWTFWLNSTSDTQHAQDKAAVAKDQFDLEQATLVKNLDASRTNDSLTLRQLKKIGAVDISLTVNESKTFHNLVSTMSNIYSTAYVCNRSTPNCDQSTDPSQKWNFNPTLDTIMGTSRDYDLLAYVWQKWRDASGAKMLGQFKDYVALANRGAMNAGYADYSESWRAAYENAHFRQQCEDIWKQVLPLYEHLHTYIRRILLTKFYSGKFNTSALPAHILGNMWAQEWVNLFDDTAPYPDQPSVDVTPNMIKQNYTVKRMFETAEDFFASIGLFKMTPEFWKNSMLTRPADPKQDVDCWPDAEEFYNGRDYGIKMCGEVKMNDLITIHHEMGHIQYFMSYSKQPIKFHDGANPGFHEAIGDTIALSVGTPGHLNKIGLLDGYDPSSEAAKKQNLNFLYKTALEKIAFLPFGYLIDQFRWQVFDGTVPVDRLNDGWWAARKTYQGVVPPVSRTNSDFDAGAKYHVAANVPYIAYFVSHILQFQFHKALCQAAGHTGPLHTCDIYNSSSAGHLLKNMLQLGSSLPWPEALQQIAGTDRMDASALMEYFEDLIQFLNKTNTANNECYGWGHEWPDYYDLPQPRCGKYLPSGSATTTAAPSSTPQSHSVPDNNSDLKPLLITTIVLAALSLVVILVGIVYLIRNRSK